jgi:hypothetical protein
LSQRICERLRDWSLRFRAGDMTVEDVQDAFAALRDQEIDALNPELSRAVAAARQELDAIHFGMCESGQADEISRVFAYLDTLIIRLS